MNAALEYTFQRNSLQPDPLDETFSLHLIILFYLRSIWWYSNSLHVRWILHLNILFKETVFSQTTGWNFFFNAVSFSFQFVTFVSRISGFLLRWWERFYFPSRILLVNWAKILKDEHVCFKKIYRKFLSVLSDLNFPESLTHHVKKYDLLHRGISNLVLLKEIWSCR